MPTLVVYALTTPKTDPILVGGRPSPRKFKFQLRGYHNMKYSAHLVIFLTVVKREISDELPVQTPPMVQFDDVT